jgi:hypothetical protein
MERHPFIIHLNEDSEIKDGYLFLYAEPNSDFINHQLDAVGMNVIIPVHGTSRMELTIDIVDKKRSQELSFICISIIYKCKCSKCDDMPKKHDRLNVLP